MTGHRKLRHVVLFQFKDSSSPQEVELLVNEFRRLPQQISAMADFEHGTNNSPEGLHEGFTHCFLISFHSEEDRVIYLNHTAHRKFVDCITPHLHKALVVDYWSDQ